MEETPQKREPILGYNVPEETRCLRAVGEGLCMKPGSYHIIWEGKFASPSCEECIAFARVNLKFLQVHKLTQECITPGTLWYEDEDICRWPQTEQDWEKGQLLMNS